MFPKMMLQNAVSVCLAGARLTTCIFVSHKCAALVKEPRHVKQSLYCIASHPCAQRGGCEVACIRMLVLGCLWLHAGFGPCVAFRLLCVFLLTQPNPCCVVFAVSDLHPTLACTVVLGLWCLGPTLFAPRSSSAQGRPSVRLF